MTMSLVCGFFLAHPAQGGSKKYAVNFKRMSIKLRKWEEREQIRISTDKKEHCLIFFHVKYFTSQLFYV